MDNYAIFGSGLYESDLTKDKLKKMALMNWMGPLVNLVAFILLFVNIYLSLALISSLLIFYFFPQTHRSIEQ